MATILGVLFGDEQYTKDEVKRQVDTALDTIDLIMQLQSSQVKPQLLRHCMLGKVNFLVRNVPPEYTIPEIRRLDEKKIGRAHV